MGLRELREQVVVSYDRLGMPSWASPHPGMASPREEEYSRFTDPGRYGIVHARARVWADRLADLSGIQVETLAPAPLDEQGQLGRFDRGVRVTSSRPGTLPLLLLERDVRAPELEVSLAVLHVSVVRPEVGCAEAPRRSWVAPGSADPTFWGARTCSGSPDRRRGQLGQHLDPCVPPVSRVRRPPAGRPGPGVLTTVRQTSLLSGSDDDGCSGSCDQGAAGAGGGAVP